MLFFVGMAFAYYLVFPLMFTFFIGSAPDGVIVATDIGRYLDFCIKLFFAFGVAFEVPVATFLIVSAGLTTVEDLRKKRAYVILSAFVLGMLLTPPDMISQTLLAPPHVGALRARARHVPPLHQVGARSRRGRRRGRHRGLSRPSGPSLPDPRSRCGVRRTKWPNDAKISDKIGNIPT